MHAFAAWLGRLAAATIAVLATVWLFEAMPPAAEARDAMQRACRAAQPVALWQQCAQLGAGWDQNLLSRALLGYGAGVALLLLAAMVPTQRK
jgi:hypothetical protein